MPGIGGVVSQAAKSIGEAIARPTAQAAKDMGQVAVESLTGSNQQQSTQPPQDQGPKVDPAVQQQRQVQDQKKASWAMSVINRYKEIDAKIEQIRQARKQKEQQKEQEESQLKQVKQFELQEKKQRRQQDLAATRAARSREQKHGAG